MTGHELKQALRSNTLHDAHFEDPEFGYLFLADKAKALGASMCARTAWRLCRDKGWWSLFGKMKEEDPREV